MHTTFDEKRYSRQSYSIGQDMMCKISAAQVLIISYSSLSLEIIKNMSLLGIGNIDICHNKKIHKQEKASLYYDNKSKLPIDDFKKLNPSVKFNQVNILNNDNKYNIKMLKKYNLIIITNSTFEEAIKLNNITHELNIPFIMTGCYGLTGYVFNDWCDNFTINDIDGETYENLLIKNIDGKQMEFKERHNLSDGDILIATINADDETKTQEMQIKRMVNHLLIEFEEIPEQDISSYKMLIKKKMQQNIKFKKLADNYKNIEPIIADFSHSLSRATELHEIHLAYSKFVENTLKTPRSWNIEDFNLFTSYIENWETKSDEYKILAKKFCFTTRGNVLPFISIIASVISHEILKVLGHKYIPINQWYYLDYLEMIENKEIINFKSKNSKRYRTTSKYEGLVNVFGKELVEKIQNTKPFIVGSGAIGCELIKNLGMFGVKEMYLTDMDNIEKSNLSRQFLFNDEDIRKSKSQTASKKIKLMNPDTNVIVYENKVCKETEDIFNNDFHNKIDIYLNALDNQDARIYMDNLAIKYSKPLIDSGTTGGKGNIQVIVPHLTETYGSSKDPEDNVGIPICTIKSFPFKQSHTIQWSRELFETEFNELPSKIHKYSKEKLMDATPTEIQNMLKLLYKYRNFTISEEGYFQVLSHIFIENFDYNIIELIKEYSGTEKETEIKDKILPTLLNLEEQKERINNFMISGFKILSQIFETDIEYKSKTDYLIHESSLNIDYKKIITEYDYNYVEKIINNLKKIKKVDFEKDDDDLGHVFWLLETTNLRNIQYKIDLIDLFSARKIAGNIIPAMITTTALVSGFQILEYIKIIKFHKEKPDKKDIELYKNRFVNLNINYIDGINPGKAKITKIGNYEFSIWNKIIINSKCVETILEKIFEIVGLAVEYLMQGETLIFDGETILINHISSTDLCLFCLVQGFDEIAIPIFIK
jgi:ubiquitin-activating enzyme E1